MVLDLTFCKNHIITDTWFHINKGQRLCVFCSKTTKVGKLFNIQRSKLWKCGKIWSKLNCVIKIKAFISQAKREKKFFSCFRLNKKKGGQKTLIKERLLYSMERYHARLLMKIKTCELNDKKGEPRYNRMETKKCLCKIIQRFSYSNNYSSIPQHIFAIFVSVGFGDALLIKSYFW